MGKIMVNGEDCSGIRTGGYPNASDQIYDNTSSTNVTATNVQGAIENLDDALTAVQTDIDSLETAVTGHTTQISNLETAVGNASQVSGMGDGTVAGAAAEANRIAKGAAQSRTFDTFADMETWLKNSANKGLNKAGDNLYIVTVDVPDYWITEVLDAADSETGYYYRIAQLETQKVDLSEYDTRLDGLDTTVAGLQSTVNDCFQSVSDGKTLVANAITGKGVNTAANAEFATMATNIENIKTDPVLQAKSVALSTSDQTITPDNTYDGLSSVSVPAVTGTAATGDVLFGKTFSSAAGVSITGTLADKTGTSNYTGTESLDSTNKLLKLKVPATGKYSTGNYLTSTFAKIASLIGLTSAKLVKGNTILGISGNSNNMDTSGGDATAAQILSGKKACVDGSLITGTMANKAGATVAASAVSSDNTNTYLTIPTAGYYDKNSKISTLNGNIIENILVSDGGDIITGTELTDDNGDAILDDEGLNQFQISLTQGESYLIIVTTEAGYTVLKGNQRIIMNGVEILSNVNGGQFVSTNNLSGSNITTYVFIIKAQQSLVTVKGNVYTYKYGSTTRTHVSVINSVKAYSIFK